MGYKTIAGIVCKNTVGYQKSQKSFAYRLLGVCLCEFLVVIVFFYKKIKNLQNTKKSVSNLQKGGRKTFFDRLVAG